MSIPRENLSFNISVRMRVTNFIPDMLFHKFANFFDLTIAQDYFDICWQART
jgi:hypothetical protein